MPPSIHLEPYLTTDHLEARYRQARDPVEHNRWHVHWLLARGMTATAAAKVTGYSAYWIGQIAQRYNRDGPEGVCDRRHRAGERRLLLSEKQRGDLRAAITAPHPEGDRWCRRTVAAWISQRLGRRVGRQLGWTYLRRLGARLRAPCPRHVQTDLQAQADFKHRLRPLPRAVATAFPRRPSSCRAVDEHRIGLKPLLKKVWTLPTFPSQRPIAPVEHRYEWRYLVGFVYPVSGRTVWHLATTVNIELFSVELDAFAQQVGASPTKQIVLVLDGAGWHASPKVQAPEHVHLLFMPPYSPALQPVEHLWPLTNSAVANRHFASIDELEDVQAARCITLQACPDLIRSTTLFHCWPRRITKRQGPRSR